MFPQSFFYFLNGELYAKLHGNNLNKFIFFFKHHSQGQYKILSDICAIDYPWKKARFELYYNILSLDFNSRINVIVTLGEQDIIGSLENIYKVAGWFEREIWDMFGIFFSQNMDLRRILTDYGFKGHPLRKDFPMTGYTEVHYSHIEKRVCIEEVNLMQEYRTFTFKNSWKIFEKKKNPYQNAIFL